MTTAEQIKKQVEKFPESVQSEVLDFIEFLEAKLEDRSEEARWESFSLKSAMRGMESEETAYSRSDMIEEF